MPSARRREKRWIELSSQSMRCGRVRCDPCDEEFASDAIDSSMHGLYTSCRSMSSKPLILVVDDDAPIVILMRSLLREFGFEPMTAMNGQDALTAVRAQTPDLILVDKNMPGMSGEEVVQAMRREAGLASVPILMLTGEPLDAVELRRIGANRAVQKPFDVMALVEEIRGLTGGEPPRREAAETSGEPRRRPELGPKS